MELPDVAAGDINVEMILKGANDVHNVEGGKSKVLDEIGIVNESFFARDLINDLANEFKKAFFHEFTYLILYEMALDLLKRGFREFLLADADHLYLLIERKLAIYYVDMILKSLKDLI